MDGNRLSISERFGNYCLFKGRRHTLSDRIHRPLADLRDGDSDESVWLECLSAIDWWAYLQCLTGIWADVLHVCRDRKLRATCEGMDLVHCRN